MVKTGTTIILATLGIIVVGGIILASKKAQAKELVCPPVDPMVPCPTAFGIARCGDGKTFSLSGCEFNVTCANIKCTNHNGFKEWVM